MSSLELQASLVAGALLGRRAYYFGCWNRPGHYLHDPYGGMTFGSNHCSDILWHLGAMDGVLLKNGNIPDAPTGKVYWTAGGANAFWYAFFWWDRSVDKRPNSNSGFYVRGFERKYPKQAFDFACEQFPGVVARQRFPLALQVDWRTK